MHDWRYLKNKYKEIELDESDTFDVPEWRRQIISQRLKDYHDNPDKILDWDIVQKEIEGEYGF